MSTSEKKSYIPYKHLVIVAVLVMIVFVRWLFMPDVSHEDQQGTTIVSLNLPSTADNGSQSGIDVIVTEQQNRQEQVAVEDTPVSESEPLVLTPARPQPPLPPPPKTEDKVIVSKGDTLSKLFDDYDLGQTALRNILSADESLLALETVRPGQILYFRYYKDSAPLLREMELFKHSGHRIIYRRIEKEANDFEYEVIRKEGEWRDERVSGTIEGSFYLSAQRAGLTEIETAIVTQIFKDQLNFVRSISKGDKFQIVRNVQYIDGKPTGQTRIESARIQRRAHEHTAFLFEDGRYYDKKGKSLARAFRRTPLAKHYRVSSRFNPRRVHPVTGRVGPHNGTDFATPSGTLVLSTGDGVVARVGNHPFAGRYIDIQHGGQYKTRYLHLKKVLVHRGESVSRGQAIALSGNTGRSTGPHLHFELHVRGRPVDPMKAKIPIAKSIPKKHKQAFAKTVKEQTRILDAKNTSSELATNNNGE